MNASHNLRNTSVVRIVVLVLFGFSSGLPIVLISSTLQAWYTTAGVDLLTIGALSLVGQPYVYKFLWAPILDRFTPFYLLGRRRSWIFLMQISLVVGLITMAFMDPARTPWLLAVAALWVAFSSASQDIALDAYRTDLLTAKERGLGASLNTVGYRVAMLVAGALALIMADQWGWHLTYLVMAGLIALGLIVTFFAPLPPYEQAPPTSLTQAVVEPLREFFSRKYAIIILLFIVIYKLSDVLALSLNTTFLLRGVGFSLTDVGVITKTVGIVAALIGSLIGGILSTKLGEYRSLLYFGVLQMIGILSFAVLAWVGKNYWVMAASIFIFNFFDNLSSVALVMVLMGLCDHRYTATQYALFSALTAVGRIFLGPVAAILVAKMGWFVFYLFSIVMGVPALLLLVWLRYGAKMFAMPTPNKLDFAVSRNG